MSTYLTIDGGTTNTRIRLVRDGKVLDVLKLHAGARSGFTDAAGLKSAVRDGIREVLSHNALQEKDLQAILACGMLGSESGLTEVPHIKAPAGIRELHKSMLTASLPEISDLPLHIVRGVKQFPEQASYRDIDIMRGEETELYGLIENPDADTLYILPGSHSKLIETDSQGRISQFETLLSGEMIEALSQHTILRSAVHLENNVLDESALRDGYRYAETEGINKALFKARILKTQLSASDDTIYSFFLGVVLKDEIRAILKKGRRKIVIGGKGEIKRPMSLLLSAFSESEITVLPDELTDEATTRGLIRIYEYKGGCR